MKIRHLSISGFRGINHFEWSLPEKSIYCLIGPGDSTKSTILEAIEWALSPRWNMAIYDSDFYNCNVENPIDIRVTIGCLPESIQSLHKYGPYTRGWRNGTICDEPEPDCENVLTVRLTVDRTLEPSWTLFTERNETSASISAREREKLGMIRLGPYVDRHLTWGYGSALTRLTDNPDGSAGVLAEANRQARQSITPDSLRDLKDVANRVQSFGEIFGVHLRSGYIPAVDPIRSNDGIGSLVLYDGDVPLRLAGQGTRRLLAMALQQGCIQDGAIQLVDEVEQGLEPHRVRHLLHVLDKQLNQPSGNHNCQIFLTTHSTDVIEELQASDLWVVRSVSGVTTVKQVSAVYQKTIRAKSRALLARKVLFCEGKTEEGICRAVDRLWASEPGGKYFAHLGVTPLEGRGSNGAEYASHLHDLGYQVAYLVDHDRSDSAKILAELGTRGIEVFSWGDHFCTEQRLCADLPLEKLQDLVNQGIHNMKEQGGSFEIKQTTSQGENILGQDIKGWLQKGMSEQEARITLGTAAKNGGWFKRIDFGEQLGSLIYQALPDIYGTDTQTKLAALRAWCYDESNA